MQCVGVGCADCRVRALSLRTTFEDTVSHLRSVRSLATILASAVRTRRRSERGSSGPRFTALFTYGTPPENVSDSQRFLEIELQPPAPTAHARPALGPLATPTAHTSHRASARGRP